MKRSVRLFIGGMEVEFKTTPDILYNFQVDSLMNPSAVKNSYSKTVQIPGTYKNNRIFNSFFLNDYRTTANNFDASKKTEFTIYLDNEVYESGYCKLDSVSQNKHYWEYSVTLFGGLGSFIYNLAYSDNPAGYDEKRKISDLEFYAGPDSNTPIDIGFEINKETIKEARENIDTNSSKWHIINFAPAYNGLPQDFDADKVLMNIGTIQNSSTDSQGRPVRRSGGRGSVVTTSVTDNGVTYQTYGGYALATLSREYTQPEMREFRSYLMRPVLNVQRTIEAMCRPEQNGGFNVELDPDFFYYDNPYYADMWMTLPMLSSLEYTHSVVASGVTAYLTGGSASGNLTTGDPGYYRDFLVAISEPDSGMAYDVNVKLNLFANGIPTNAQENLVLCAYSPTYHFHYASAIFVQLVAYDAFGNPVAGSDVHYITSSYGARRVGRNDTVAYSLEPDDWDYNMPYGNGYVKSKGSYFHKVSSTEYQWNEEISLTAQNVPAGSTLKVLVTKVYKAGGTQNGPKYLFYRYTQSGELTRYTAYTFNDFSVVINSSTVAFKSNEGIRTGAAFSKKQLLNTNFSCADFLLSYCKIFGLYLVKDPADKKISILTRKNFFKRDEIINVERLIDRQSLKITPLVFDSKWYDWNLDADESEYGKAYENTYGKKYGQQKINTGYNFNKATKEVFDDNIFKSAVQVLERSNAFCFTGQDTTSKPWMFPGYSYLLYDTSDATNTYEVTVDPSSTIDAYSAFTAGYMYYDLFDKVQLHTADNSPADGTNVLLMRSGDKALTVGSVNLNYYITDDNSYMNILNDGRPCWLLTNNETDAMGNSLAKRVTSVPYFSRYKISDGNGYILRSLDFGKPDEIYIPNAVYRQGCTIYEAFWQSYISDLYSKDSRVIRTKMLIRETPTVNWLRRFYSFDSSIWRMVDIKDYNVGTEKLTEVEFVKVQDVNNYNSEVISSNPTITLTLSTNEVGPTGGTVTYTVSVSDGGAWYIENDAWNISSLSATAGTGDYTGTWTINPNRSSSELNLTITAFADNASSRATVTLKSYSVELIQETQGNVSWRGGSVAFRVISPEAPWSAKTDYTGIITSFSPSNGAATDSGGTTFFANWAANDNESTRDAWIYVQLPNGQTARSGYIRQEASNGATISVTPDYIGNVPYSGAQYTVVVYSTNSWTGYVTYPDRISLSQTTGSSGYTDVVITVNPNTGDSRFAQAFFYRDGYNQNDSITISQDAFEEPTSAVTFTLTETGGTFAWYSAGNIIPYRKTNVDTVYVDYSADWITSIQTDTTGATVWVTSNRTGSQRSTTIRFSIDGETFPYIYQATQNYDETSVSAFTITSGDDITIGASGGTWSIGYETTLTGITYEFMQGSNTLLASGSTSSSPLALTVQPNEYTHSKTYVTKFYSGGNAVGIASLFQFPAEESGGTDYSEQYLTLERVQYGSSPDNGISMGLNLKVNSLKTSGTNETWNGDSGVTFEFSIDDGDTWYTANESLSNAMSIVGDRIMLRASASTLTYDSIRLYVYKNGGYDMFKVYGNPLSLIYGSDFNQSHANETIVLRRLFRQNTLLRSAEGLAIPYHTGATYNLREMFQRDYYMRYSPESIPDCDTNAAQMFYNCSALTTAPVVNIYNYANSDFSQMFYHCSALNEVTFKCVLPNTGGGTNEAKYNEILKNAGSGVFKKNPDATVYLTEGGSGTWLQEGTTSSTFSHIPTNWTVEDYTSGSTPDTGSTPTSGSSLQSNQIRYKTSDNGQLPYWSAMTSEAVYANVVSNTQQSDLSWIVTFDSAITSFYRTASYHNSNLTYLELPDSVTYISIRGVSGNTYITELVAYGLKRLPSNLTSGCTAFTSITVGTAMTYVNTNAIVNRVRQSGAYYTDKTVELHYPGTMSEWDANVSYAFTPSSAIAAGKNYVKIICSDGTMTRFWE